MGKFKSKVLHLKFDFLASMKTLGQRMFKWNSTNYIRTYIQLQKQTDPKNLESKLPAFLKKCEYLLKAV